MARRGRRRDTSFIASDPLESVPDFRPRLLPSFNQNPPSVRSILSAIEDRRIFQPDGLDLPRSTRRWHSRIVLARERKGQVTKGHRAKLFRPEIHAFKAPDYVAICIRRKRRKEIMHALKKAGRGGMKKPRRNYWSNISCR